MTKPAHHPLGRCAGSFCTGSGPNLFFFLLDQLLFQCRLLGQDGVDFVVEVFDHDFGLEIDLVIILRAAAVFSSCRFWLIMMSGA